MKVGLAALVLCSAIAPIASAQWITIKTPDVPRLGNGSPDLTASAPRMADGRPDFSGIWLLTARPNVCPDLIRDGQDCLEKDLPVRQAVNLGDGMAGGLPYQPWAAALVRQRTSDFSKDDPHAHCLPSNPPRI